MPGHDRGVSINHADSTDRLNDFMQMTQVIDAPLGFQMMIDHGEESQVTGVFRQISAVSFAQLRLNLRYVGELFLHLIDFLRCDLRGVNNALVSYEFCHTLRPPSVTCSNVHNHVS